MTSTGADRNEQREPELVDSVYRTARKPWSCECPGNGRRPCPHGDDCAERINPGDRYVEYLGEAAAYGSGTRYCLPCGVATWRADEWQAREAERRPYRSVTAAADPFALCQPEPLGVFG